MKKLLLLSALLIFACGFGLTPITDANFSQAIETCLSTHPVTGMCSDSEYGAMPNWDVSQVTDMSYAFSERVEFNADISNWDVSSVNNMEWMFYYAESFNQPLNNWNVSNVTKMQLMFRSSSFNQDISGWDVSNVTDMFGVFSYTAFNQPIGDWDVSNVTSMNSMFSGSVFNQDIGNWNVSNVTIFAGMFNRAAFFNQDIGNWDTSSATNINSMFAGGGISESYGNIFNQDISNWDVSNVTDMNTMFYNNSAFDKNLGNWNVSNVTKMQLMFKFSALSTENYDNTLIGWSQQALQTDVILDAEEIFYCNSETERQSMIDNFGWTINDAGYNCETAGIDDLGITSFSIYPNPTKEYLNIDCSSLESVSVYNILGKELLKGNNNRIDVSSFSKGVYFIKVSDGINASTKKFIKD